ncbi:ATP-dependent RecD-like DNA helicase [Gemmata sp. JC717]|uniref:SF1B family DNA helicase RecD2 n=1 Tax=Gemmata algarum TaxID=2975278 RepID=UPI0021BB0C8E|nr:ATP-dependent RecD-like DNA helicase [Gemmata algarum]MDY3556431.1 ATP-dependent RecD-like DNA helicase [Gemmata algarum]
MSEQVTGVIERITHHNPDTGYCVLRVLARGHRDIVTVVGSAQQVVAGEYVTATGVWVNDRNYGKQFKATEVKTNPPHTKEGIVKYLGSGLVKGIGPGYARRIVDVFGDRTLEVIDTTPVMLTQVKGIGPKLVEKIRKSWEEQRESQKILVFLQSHGIGTARAVRIYKTYGDQAIELIKANPYRLSGDIWGFGFKTADQLAVSLGIPPDSPFRAQAAVRHVLQEETGNGHVGFPEELLREKAAELTGIEPNGIIDAVEQLRITDEIVRDSVGKATGGKVNAPPPQPQSQGEGPDGEPAKVRISEEDLLFLKPMFLAEVGVARSIRALAAGPHPLPSVNVEAAVNWIEQKMGIAFATSQRAAIKSAVTNKMMVVTGGPGTGKTTIVRAIIEMFLAKSLRVLLTAPTGRAAKRLNESTGREAKTIHRLLEFNPQQRQFTRNAENPLDVDLLVVDETSMVDVVLMNKLLQAVPPYACVVLVGDVDQLPSVGAGSVLTDLIDSKVVLVARLTEVHRQAESSWIVRAAHAINSGLEPLSAPPGGDGDFYFVEANDPDTILARVVQMVRDRIPARFNLNAFRDVQVLCPQLGRSLGVENMNRELQQALNPPRPGLAEVQRNGETYRIGDKVMQVQNNYDREVFNGDIGRIDAIDTDEQMLVVDYDGRFVEYEFSDLDELQLSFACTIHKSQGSEYPAVVIPVHTQHFVMLQRNLLYTGITRGRKLVALVGSRKAMRIAVSTADTKKRFSLLKWRIKPQD